MLSKGVSKHFSKDHHMIAYNPALRKRCPELKLTRSRVADFKISGLHHSSITPKGSITVSHCQQ
jgi:hypothetical protein